MLSSDCHLDTLQRGKNRNLLLGSYAMSKKMDESTFELFGPNTTTISCRRNKTVETLLPVHHHNLRNRSYQKLLPIHLSLPGRRASPKEDMTLNKLDIGDSTLFRFISFRWFVHANSGVEQDFMKPHHHNRM